MTENEIDEIQSEIDDCNAISYGEARAAFKKGPIPKMKWVLEELLGCLLRRIATVRAGDAPEAFGGYMGDELARVLATKTFLEYAGRAIDRAAAEAADSGTDSAAVTYDCVMVDMTDEYEVWLKILSSLDMYLHEAAVLAKAVNPSSTAARLYLRAWRFIKPIKDRGYAQRDEALAILRLERVAADRLWVDAQFAALPPFKANDKAKKAKGTAKA